MEGRLTQSTMSSPDFVRNGDLGRLVRDHDTFLTHLGGFVMVVNHIQEKFATQGSIPEAADMIKAPIIEIADCMKKDTSLVFTRQGEQYPFPVMEIMKTKAGYSVRRYAEETGLGEVVFESGRFGEPEADMTAELMLALLTDRARYSVSLNEFVN